MVRRFHSFAIAGAMACIATACTGASISRAVDYDTATATVAALVSAVADNDQAKVDALTTHPGKPPPSRESIAIVARAVDSPAASSTVADPFDDPTGAINDMEHLRRYFGAVGELEAYEWDADFHALALKFACGPSNGPRCVNRLYFTFDKSRGDDARVDMMIGVHNTPAWAKAWADLPNSRDLKAAVPAPAVAQALARLKTIRPQSAN